jgi:predicted lipoprotein with Yx(FWY)xxD motif
MRLETAPVGGAGPEETVLAVSMNDSFSLFADGSFPVYTLNADQGHTSACEGQCALAWPPVLTSGRPEIGSNIPRHALGAIMRPDGSHQVTFKGKPLYLYAGDAYIPGIPGVSGPAAINGAGLTTPWGTFHTIVASS